VYEMLTGQPLFTGATTEAVVYKIHYCDGWASLEESEHVAVSPGSDPNLP
jgi:hypothetical protein